MKYSTKKIRLAGIALACLPTFIIGEGISARTPGNLIDERETLKVRVVENEYVCDTLMIAPDVNPLDMASHFRVGLVLSGGGAKGIAHIGVIKALEENDIAIDCVTGTSMGAVVGSLYSCGYSPERMMELIKSPIFQNCATGTIDPAYEYYFSRHELSPAWANVNISFHDNADNNIAGQILPLSLVNPIPMNMEFLKLFTPYSSQCGMDFDRLMVPFRCVTSDVYHKHKIVLRNGLLGRAVRASMSFPLVFRPIEMDGVLVYDGGIYDNFPVDVMQEDFNPDFIIGVSVSGPDGKPEKGNIMSQLEDMIIQNNDYSVPSSNGIKIQCPVLNFGVLDFGKADTIYEIGYRTGLQMVDSIKKRTPARRTPEEVARNRGEFASHTPLIEFNDVEVSDGTPSQRRYLQFLFNRGLPDEPFGMEQTQDSYYRAVCGGKLANLMLVPKLGVAGRDSAGIRSNNVLLLQPEIKNPWNIGAGGWITTDTQSMLYLDFGYHTLSYNSLDADFSGWIGQSYLAGMLSGKFTVHSRLPAYLKLEAVASRQKFYASQLKFYQMNAPTFISEDRRFLNVRYCLATGRKSIFMASIGYGSRIDKYYPESDVDYSVEKRDRIKMKHSVLDAGWEYNTLDNRLYPLSGRQLDLHLGGEWSLQDYTPGTAMGGDARKFRRQWRPRAELKWREYWELHRKVHFGAYVNALFTGGPVTGSYSSALVMAPAFAPTPSTSNFFNPAFRADNYAAAGVMPVWSPVSKLQLRGEFYGYIPLRDIIADGNGMARHAGWLNHPEFIGEVAAVYTLPFASLSVYGNYISSPGDWNFGVTLGVYILAPKMGK